VTRVTCSDERILIYDDFLPEDAAEALREHANSDRYSMVHREHVQKVWRLGDGFPMHGTTTYYRPDGMYEPAEEPHHPTETPLDRFIEELGAVLPDAERLVGKRGTAWSSIILTPWVYPAGSGLSLHRDSEEYAGAYTYFLHREWSFHWGGHLLVFDPATPDLEDVNFFPPWLSESEESRLVAEPGIATCILPKPNRLVFLASSAFHMVTRVDANAGNRPRVTLSGFFMASAAPAG
jgi:hypothetical protein